MNMRLNKKLSVCLALIAILTLVAAACGRANVPSTDARQNDGVPTSDSGAYLLPDWFDDPADLKDLGVPEDPIWNALPAEDDPAAPAGNVEDINFIGKLNVSDGVMAFLQDEGGNDDKYLALAVKKNDLASADSDLPAERRQFEFQVVWEALAGQNQRYVYLNAIRKLRDSGYTEEQIRQNYSAYTAEYTKDGAFDWEKVEADYAQLRLIHRTAEEIVNRYVSAAEYEQFFKDAGAITCVKNSALYVFIRLADFKTLDFEGIDDLYFSLAYRETFGQ